MTNLTLKDLSELTQVKVEDLKELIIASEESVKTNLGDLGDSIFLESLTTLVAKLSVNDPDLTHSEALSVCLITEQNYLESIIYKYYSARDLLISIHDCARMGMDLKPSNANSMPYYGVGSIKVILDMMQEAGFPTTQEANEESND